MWVVVVHPGFPELPCDHLSQSVNVLSVHDQNVPVIKGVVMLCIGHTIIIQFSHRGTLTLSACSFSCCTIL